MSQKQLILHVGTHKTGTTALQQFFSLNRKLLGKMQIDYQNVSGGDAGHHRLGWAFHKRQGRTVSVYPPDLKSPDEEWARALVTDRAKLLLSSETLCACYADDYKSIREYASGFEVKCVIYLRRQDAMTNSIYNQITKGSARKWHEYDKPPYKLNYIQCIDNMAAAFGSANIIVRVYENQQFYGGNIFADFLYSVFGLELTGQYEIPEGDINGRLHRIVLEYKCLLNYLPIPFDELFSTVGPLLQASSKFYADKRPDPPLLSPQKRLEIIQEWEPMNQQIARNYLGRADGRLFYDALPDPNESWRPYAGLKEEDACTINEYLAARYPATLSIIAQGIRAAQSSSNPKIKKAAALLSCGLPPESKQYRQRLYKPTRTLRVIYNRLPSRLKPIVKKAAIKMGFA